LQRPAWTGTDFVFSFLSEAGRAYDVQSTDALGTGSWGVLMTVPGTGGMLTITNRNPTVGGRFYRVEAR
jgi:hypothetical protein